MVVATLERLKRLEGRRGRRGRRVGNEVLEIIKAKGVQG